MSSESSMLQLSFIYPSKKLFLWERGNGNFSYIFIAIMVLIFLLFPNTLSAETQIQKSPNAVPSPTQKIHQSTIPYSIFEQEFMFTNTPEDYQRSFLRLKQRYGLNVSLKVLETIMFGIKSDENLFKSATKDLINEAILFSRFEDNKYYEKLHDLTKFADKLNFVARIEIQLVDQLRRLSSVPTPLLDSLSSQIRFRYLINHARYEITSAALNYAVQVD